MAREPSRSQLLLQHRAQQNSRDNSLPLVYKVGYLQSAIFECSMSSAATLLPTKRVWWEICMTFKDCASLPFSFSSSLNRFKSKRETGQRALKLLQALGCFRVKHVRPPAPYYMPSEWCVFARLLSSLPTRVDLQITSSCSSSNSSASRTFIAVSQFQSARENNSGR